MSLASKELGPDAMLLGSRQAPAEAGRPGEYEVTFCPSCLRMQRRNRLQPKRLRPGDNIRRELLDLRNQMEAHGGSRYAIAGDLCWSGQPSRNGGIYRHPSECRDCRLSWRAT